MVPAYSSRVKAKRCRCAAVRYAAGNIWDGKTINRHLSRAHYEEEKAVESAGRVSHARGKTCSRKPASAARGGEPDNISWPGHSRQQGRLFSRIRGMGSQMKVSCLSGKNFKPDRSRGGRA